MKIRERHVSNLKEYVEEWIKKRTVKNINHENVVYLLWINWSHFNVIKWYRLTGTAWVMKPHSHHTAIDWIRSNDEKPPFSMQQEKKHMYREKKKNYTHTHTPNTCKCFCPLAAFIYYQPIDKYACRRYNTRYTVIECVNTQWWKAKFWSCKVFISGLK